MVFYLRATAVKKKVDNVLSRSEAHSRLLLETVPHGIQEIDLTGTVTFSNSAHDRMHGYEPGETVGMKIWDFVASVASRASTAWCLTAK